MMRMAARCLSIAALIGLCSAALADSLSEGRELYRAGRYAEAAQKLEQAVREQPNDARAWWQLNFAYNRLERHADALAAVRKAAAIDPALGFASEPGKVRETIERLERRAGAGAQTAPPPAPASRPAARSGGDDITRALMEGDVYVARGAPVDAARLAAVARELRPTVVKFVVLNSRADSRALMRDADRVREFLREYINRGEGYVIVASRSAVAISSGSMSRAQLEDMARQGAQRMSAGDLTGGLEALARGLVMARPARAEARTGPAAGGLPAPTPSPWPRILLVAGVAVAAIVIVATVARRGAAAKRMAARREPLERLRGDVIGGMNYLDNVLPTLAPGVAASVRELRVSAGTRLDEAARLLAKPRNELDLDRAQGLLDVALAEVNRGRAAVERAQSGDPTDAAASGTATPPVYAGAAPTDRETDWDAIPENERGACFFCSRPSRFEELTPVTVTLEGEQRKVLACADDLDAVRSGEAPRIRTLDRGGRRVPWYADEDYDPYRDYYRRGYDNRSLLSDFLLLSMIDSMFWRWHQPVGWGWGGGWDRPYVFHSDHDTYHDYYSRSATSAGAEDFGGSDRDVQAGGADFLEEASGGAGEAGQSGGFDFGGDQS